MPTDSPIAALTLHPGQPHDPQAWLDEDGAAAGKLPNQAATLVARSFGFEFGLCGAVVITGLDKDTAGPADLSSEQAGAILGKIRAPSA